MDSLPKVAELLARCRATGVAVAYLTSEREIALGGAKQRSLLALLLLARGRAVATDTLIEEIWNGAAPETARKSIHGYVAALRDALGDDRIQTVDRGYALRVEPGEVDADRLEDVLRASADDEPAQTIKHLRRALSSTVARLLRGERITSRSPRGSRRRAAKPR